MQTVKVLNSVAASGADATISSGILSVVGQRINLRNLRGSSVQPYVAAVLQVNTATPTSANGTVFSYTIGGRSTIDNSVKTWTATVTSAASATATTIVTQLKAKFAQFYDIPCTFSGTATLIITGIAGSPEFTSAQAADSAGVIATAATTPVTIGYGAGTLIAAGNVLPMTGDTQIVTTNNYTTVTINYIEDAAVETRNRTHETLKQLVIYVNEGDSDYVQLVGTYGTLTQALSGFTATYVTSPAGSTPTLAYTSATGALLLAGAGNTWAANSINQGDILYYPSAPTVFYPVNEQSSNVAGFSGAAISADVAAAAYAFIRLRRAI